MAYHDSDFPARHDPERDRTNPLEQQRRQIPLADGSGTYCDWCYGQDDEHAPDCLWDALRQQTERVEALVGYVAALRLNCEKQSVLLMVHGNSDPWAESRRVFDALPEDVKELLRAADAVAVKEKP